MLEEEMDSIEAGKKNFEDVLREVYSEVKEIIKNGMQRGVKYPNISPEILN
jgi:DNA topoisomerase IA